VSFWKSLRSAHFTRISHDGRRRAKLGVIVIFLLSIKAMLKSVAT